METFPRLGDLTTQQRADIGVINAMRFLGHCALTDAGPVAAAVSYIDRFPRDIATALLRKALADGDLVQKSVAPATTTNVPYAGALLPPALLDPLVNRLQQATVLARIPGLVRAPLNVPIPTESAAPSMKWVAQGAPKHVSTLTLANVTLALYKFAGILTLSDELAKATRGGAEAIMSRLLIDASARFLDAQFLDPAVTAVADKNPASITNGHTPVAAGATLDDTLTALVAAFYAQRPNALLPTFLLSPLVAAKISATGHHPALLTAGGTLLGAPAVVTVGAGPNVVLIDAAGVYYHDGGAEVDTSRHAAIEAEATPTNPPTAATVILDLWSHNLVGIRLDRFCSWQAEPSAVAYTVAA